jgi:hypothetical protein
MLAPVVSESESMTGVCCWLFGRGASISNGLGWAVPDEWNDELMQGNITREAQVERIVTAIRDQMALSGADGRTYDRLLEILQASTKQNRSHLFLTTTWDFLLHRSIVKLRLAMQPEWLDAHVYHLNGTVEQDGETFHSDILLETDTRERRCERPEFGIAYNKLLFARMLVVVGMSFACATDRHFLELLSADQDNVPLGEGTIIVVNFDRATLDRTVALLKASFRRATMISISSTFDEWIDSGMRELVVANYLTGSHPSPPSL